MFVVKSRKHSRSWRQYLKNRSQFNFLSRTFLYKETMHTAKHSRYIISCSCTLVKCYLKNDIKKNNQERLHNNLKVIHEFNMSLW